MKVALDLEQLLVDNHITQAEYEKLKAFANQSTSTLAFNILLGFGVVAVSGAALALIPTPITAIFIGAMVLIAGIVIFKTGNMQWKLLAQICILVGALMLGGGILLADNGNPRSFIAIAGIYTIAAIFAQSGLLTALAVLSVGPILGANSGYAHATYMIGVQEPMLCITAYSILGMGLYWLSQRLMQTPVPLVYSQLMIIASRTSLFMVNLGFWIGSLWGDTFYALTNPVVIPETVFAITWAIALVACGIWAWYKNLRWVLNVVAIFGGIHFYTQWFEHLSASPLSVLLAGVMALVFALMLKYMNAKMIHKK